MLSLIRTIRHGPLKSWNFIWVRLGKLYRFVLDIVPIKVSIEMSIGPYGPFKMDARFAFSDYKSWGGRTGKNSGFISCIDACKGSSCVLDIGAHIGLVALPVSKVLAPKGRVYAFEPATFNRNILLRHAKLNNANNIEIIDSLVGEKEVDKVVFYESKSDSPLGTIALGSNQGDFIKKYKRQVSIDSFCEQKGIIPEVIKIDVEGAELGVLRGAQKILKRYRPTIILSVHPRELEVMGLNENMLHSFIKSLNYICYDSNGSIVKDLVGIEYILRPRKIIQNSVSSI